MQKTIVGQRQQQHQLQQSACYPAGGKATEALRTSLSLARQALAIAQARKQSGEL